MNTLRSAEPPSRRWKLVDDIEAFVGVLDPIEGFVESLADRGIQELKNGSLRWEKGLGFLRREFGLTASQLDRIDEFLKATHVEKILIGVSLGVDGAQAWREQQTEDAERFPGMADGEHRVRDAGAAAAIVGLKVGEMVGGNKFAALCARVGASVGSLFPVIGTAAGAVVGGLVGTLFSELGERLLERLGVDDFVRRLGAVIAGALYRKIEDLAGHPGSSVTAGAENTAGEIWKELTA